MSCSTPPHQCLTKLRLSISGRCANYFSHVSGQCFVKTALISLVGCSQLLFCSFNLLLQISWKWRHEHDSIFICLGCLCCTLQQCHAVFVMDHKIARSRMHGLVFSISLISCLCMLSEDYIRTQHRTPVAGASVSLNDIKMQYYSIAQKRFKFTAAGRYRFNFP